jgi:hypothetical protein
MKAKTKAVLETLVRIRSCLAAVVERFWYAFEAEVADGRVRIAGTVKVERVYDRPYRQQS